jgi:hypothetical protein
MKHEHAVLVLCTLLTACPLHFFVVIPTNQSKLIGQFQRGWANELN